MSLRAARAILAAAVAVFLPSDLRAEIVSVVETNPYPGIRLIKRTDFLPLPLPARQVVMNIAFLDLGPTSPVRFKLNALPRTSPIWIRCAPRSPRLLPSSTGRALRRSSKSSDRPPCNT